MPPKRKHSGGKTLHREALSKTLTVAELNSIKNNTILNKLEVAIGNQDKNELNNVKVKNQKLTTELDETRQQLEQTRKSQNEETQSIAENEEGVKRENSALRVEVETLRKQVTDINTSQLNRDGDMTKIKVDRDRISAEKNGLELILKQKDGELTSLTQDFESFTTRMNDLTRERNMFKIQVEEFEVNKATDEFSVSRMRTQIEQVQNELNQMNDEVTKKDECIKEMRTNLVGEQKMRIFELGEIQKDNEALQKRIGILEDDVEEKTNQILQMTNQNEEATKEYADSEQQLRAEVITQGRLIDLLKEQLDATKEQNFSLNETIKHTKNNMERLLEENVQLKETEQRCEAMIKDLESQKKKSDHELKVANDLLTSVKKKGPEMSKEELEEFSPTAAAAVKLLRSGMTLTEMYSEYIQKSSEAERLAAENDRLNQCFDSVVEDIRAKAPLIEQQREEFQKAEGVIQNLTSQLDESVSELNVIRMELYQSNRSRDRLAHENDAFVNQIKILNNKVAILITKEDKNVMDDDEYKEHLNIVVDLQSTITEKSNAISVLETRLSSVESDGREDLEAKLKEMSHLLELEKLERANIETELGSIKQQRDTWNAYFERRKEEEEDAVDEDEMDTVDTPANLSGTRKSPRKSVSNIDNKEHMRLMMVETQFKEYKERLDDKVHSLKNKLEEQQKKNTESDCHVLKLQSELKTMDMNISMKEEFIKRNKEEIGLLNEQNQRLVKTMETESRNTTKITDEYVSLREETVQTTIALEAARKRSAIIAEELKQVKAENDMNARHDIGQNVILDTIQQLKQQITEQKVSDEIRLKADLKASQLEVEGFRVQIQTINKDREEVDNKMKEREADLYKKLEEERQKAHTISQELQRVKSRQLLAFSKNVNQSTPPAPTSPGRTNTSPISTLEVKRLNDEVRQLKSDKERSVLELEDFKKIASESEKRMNETMDSSTKIGILKEQEIKDWVAKVNKHQERVKQLENELEKLKTTDGQADIQHLHTKLANIEREAKSLSESCSIKDEEIIKYRQSYSESVIQHGKAQEESQKWRTQMQGKEIELAEIRQSCTIQKARNDSMTTEWSQEKENFQKQIKQQDERSENLNRKNQLLHEQLQQLNEQVKNSRRRASISSLDTSQTEGADESSLLELTTIMRRDQEIAETQRDVSKSETIRLKQKNRNLEAQLKLAQSALSELEEMKSKPQISSEQHKELMEQVNHLNILRESNSVLRDEKTRITSEHDCSINTIKELKLQIEPLLRKESDSKTVLDKKNTELQEMQESISKIRSDHIEQIKKLNQTRISSDHVKKIVGERDTWKKQHDQKSADLRSKDNEISEQKVEVHKLKTQVQTLEETNTKQSAEYQQIKTKTVKIRELAQKYKGLYQTNEEKIKSLSAGGAAAPKPEVIVGVKYTQTESSEEVVAKIDVDLKGENNLMKKMMQKKIEKLELDKTQVEKDLDDERKKKEKILANARRKIKQMQNDMDELRKSKASDEPKEQPIVRPLPEGKVASNVESKNVAEVNPQQREPPKQPAGRVVGTVAPTRVSEDIPINSSQSPSAVTQAPATSSGVAVVTSTHSLSVPVNPIPPVTTSESIALPTESVASSSTFNTVSSTAPLLTSQTTTIVNDADQLPEESNVDDISSTVQQPKQLGNKRSREEDVTTDTKRQKQEIAPATTTIIEIADIDDAMEPDQQDLDTKSDDEMVDEIVEPSENVPDTYPDGNGSEDEDLDEPLIEQPDQELPDIEDQPVPDSSVPFTQNRAIPPPLDHLPNNAHLRQQRTMPPRIPTTPGIITGGNDDEDGCVPRTPTLLSGRGQHEGNQALVSPAPQMQNSGVRFHFFGDNTDNDHSVPGTSDGVSSTTENNPPDN